ncbi:MAG TPA: tetratricopeptide repeat protein [Candidatus Acidoferrales bacterium]|nr:tetratricopeptide repeat protein [Candidatus Acidoferrales bacterium]
MCRIAYVAAAVLWSLSALAFANVPIGAVVENATLPALTGGEQSLLSDTNVSVFMFFEPGLEHSNQALAQIAECQKIMADKPIHWCAIVSDRIPKADVEATVEATGLQMPVLIDRGDALYGKFGVVLHPVIGVTDQQRRLVAYQPFAKVNYEAFMKAQIQHALKEITDEELMEVLKPQAAVLGGDASVAHRFFRLAEKQFQSTNYLHALTNVQQSLEKNPTAEAWSLRGRILLAQGNRPEAQAAFEASLKLDPQNAAAMEGIKTCKKSGP